MIDMFNKKNWKCFKGIVFNLVVQSLLRCTFKANELGLVSFIRPSALKIYQKNISHIMNGLKQYQSLLD